jgi:hypothetical protein
MDEGSGQASHGQQIYTCSHGQNDNDWRRDLDGGRQRGGVAPESLVGRLTLPHATRLDPTGAREVSGGGEDVWSTSGKVPSPTGICYSTLLCDGDAASVCFGRADQIWVCSALHLGGGRWASCGEDPRFGTCWEGMVAVLTSPDLSRRGSDPGVVWLSWSVVA